jgi:glycosyltransferase involved in cell wall biosynthesis
MGGVDVYAERLGRALERLGHEIGALGFDGAAEIASAGLVMERARFGSWPAWYVRFSMERRPQQAYDHAYDPEMGAIVGKVLDEARPDLFVVLNFYQVTLAAVEAARERNIPVVHVATDFIPICRRATFIRWNGASCTTGETVQSCAACFVSEDPLGRLSASILDKLPAEATQTLAGNSDYDLPHPLAPLNPYWRQVRLMTERLRILGPLRKKINLVLTPTTFTRDAFVANGFDAANVELLPFAVDADHPLGRVTKAPSDHIRFLFVGRLQPYKGAHLLLEAFDRLVDPRGATLTIYGAAGGEYEAYFHRLQRVMARNARIDFRGTIAPERLGEAFSRSDYFILPSTWHENSPLILLDALQSKTPVIASRIGGVTDAVEHESNGLLFPMGDAEALRQTLQRTIDEPGLVERLSAAVELPLIEDYAQRLLDLCGERGLLPAEAVANA